MVPGRIMFGPRAGIHGARCARKLIVAVLLDHRIRELVRPQPRSAVDSGDPFESDRKIGRRTPLPAKDMVNMPVANPELMLLEFDVSHDRFLSVIKTRALCSRCQELYTQLDKQEQIVHKSIMEKKKKCQIATRGPEK